MTVIDKTGPQTPFALLSVTLLVMTLLSQLAWVIYKNIQAAQPLIPLLLPSLAFLCLMTIPTVMLGLHFGRKTHLGAPLLTALLLKQPNAKSRLWREAKLAVSLGVILGAVILLLRPVLQPYLPAEMSVYGFRGVAGGLLVSLGAAVGEEVWFRLGIMTTLVWLASKISQKQPDSPALVWTVIVGVGVLFGLFHLPQLFANGTATTVTVIATVVGNCLVATLYGWLYWRYSLLAAIIAHFSLDIVLHSLPALF